MSVGRRLSGCWISLMPWALALSTLALDQRLFSLLCRNLAVWSQSRLWHTSNTALRVQTPSLDPWSQPSTQAVVVLVLTVILCKELYKLPFVEEKSVVGTEPAMPQASPAQSCLRTQWVSTELLWPRPFYVDKRRIELYNVWISRLGSLGKKVELFVLEFLL